MKGKMTQRISLLAALLSLPATAFFSWLVMRVLYQKFPQYEEFVTGYTSWTAYYKSGDMTLAYLVIGGVLGFYILFSVILMALSGRVSFLQGEIDRSNTEEWKHADRWERLKNAGFLLIFSEFTFAILAAVFMETGGALREGVFPILQGIVALIVGIFGFFYFKGGKDRTMKLAIDWSQCLLPMVFLYISRYEYLRNGEVFTQYDSGKMQLVASIIMWLLLGWSASQFNKNKKKEEPQIYLSSFLSLAVFASYTLPRGTISGTPLEMYHYGEISGPLHQLLNFGTVPYIDTMPIHGVCDYFQAGVWYGLFDGTYATLEPAMVIGCVIIAMITAVVYYYYVEDKFLGLLCILLFSLFGDKYYYVRWAFALPFILIVFSGKVRKRFDRLLWNWIFISILSIAWNPSIGGACALAALPMVLWEGIHEKGWRVFLTLKEKEGRRRILPWYIPLLILGSAYIPMFFAILRYIVDNSAAILETTGDILMEELTTPLVWYATFGFVFSLLAALYFLVGKKGEERKLAGYGVAFLVIFNAIIVKYTFVRTQFGERGMIVTTICSLFLILMIFLPYLKKHRSGSTLAAAVLLFLCTVVTRGSNLLTMPGRILEREEIPAEYVYASVEETGIEALGEIYITEAQKEELMSLNELANNICRDYQFVDMTNQLSHYNILNKKVLLPFSSTYNTNNRVMQTKAIKVLEELKPEVIVVSPEWKHDSGSLSTRNYYLYQYLAKHYRPCKYKEIIFLTNEEELFDKYGPAYEEFGQLMHVERLKAIPALWGNAYLKEKETVPGELGFSLVDTNVQETGDQTYQMTAEENYFMYTFERPVSGWDAQFLRISVEDLSGSVESLKFEGVVYFMQKGQTLKESHRFIYDGREGDMLIPLTTSPYWSYADDIETILVDFIDRDLPGKNLSISLEFENLK